MSGTQSRLKEFEALRGLSIMLLLALHSNVFDPVIFGAALSDLGMFIASFLLGSFFFLAGFFTEVSLSKSRRSALEFIWSKFIRIFPPYWFALLLFIFVMGYSLNRTALVAYAMNLQAVFAPTFIKSVLTLWYISMLVVFYILYGSMMLTTRSTVWLIGASAVIFILARWAYLTKGFFDPRFFQYYFMFLAGVLFCRFETIREKLFKLNILIKVLLVVVGIAVFQWALDVEYAPTQIMFIATALFFMLSLILLWLSIFQTGVGDWKIWAWLSAASFFTYLVHRPLWYVIDDIFGLEPSLPTVLIHLFPAAIVALILGYFMQLGYDRLLTGLRLK